MLSNYSIGDWAMIGGCAGGLVLTSVNLFMRRPRTQANIAIATLASVVALGGFGTAIVTHASDAWQPHTTMPVRPDSVVRAQNPGVKFEAPKN